MTNISTKIAAAVATIAILAPAAGAQAAGVRHCRVEHNSVRSASQRHFTSHGTGYAGRRFQRDGQNWR